jgi:hypothetical protein
MAVNDGSFNELPEELARALRRATDRALGELTALRKAVRQHVHDGRAGGKGLHAIQLELQATLRRALDELAASESDGHKDTLAAHMTNWSEVFYKER